MSIPHIFGIGSCRVLDPLRILSDNQSIWPHHDSVKWYTHSTRDAIQKIDIIKGRKTIPPEHIDLLSPQPEKNTPLQLPAETLNTIDCFVIEISSVKNFTFDGIEVQQWCWHNLVKEAGVDIKQFTQSVQRPAPERDLSYLSDTTPQIVKDMAVRGQLVLLDKESIINDLMWIAHELGSPLVLVPSINIKVEDGTYLADRVTISEALRDFAHRSGHTFFDPAPLILNYGRENAIIDVGHYQPGFLYILAAHLGEAIRLATLKQVA